MLLPNEVKETIRRIWPKVAHFHKKVEGRSEEEDNNSRSQGTKLIIEQVIEEHPTEDFGWKSSSRTNPPSKDAMAKKSGGKLHGWDMINGTTRELDIDHEGEDITGQNFIELQGVNHFPKDAIDEDDSDTDEPNPNIHDPFDEILVVLKDIRQGQVDQTAKLESGLRDIKDAVKDGIRVRF